MSEQGEQDEPKLEVRIPLTGPPPQDEPGQRKLREFLEYTRMLYERGIMGAILSPEDQRQFDAMVTGDPHNFEDEDE